VDPSSATLAQLQALLPGIDEAEVLRLTLATEARPDPDKQWDRSSALVTVDQRVLSAAGVERALTDAEAALHAQVSLVYSGLRGVFEAFWKGSTDDAARRLVELGERLEQDGRVRKARRCYETALHLSLPAREKSVQILALRRVARVALALGEFLEARSCYERSVELARDSADLDGEVIGRTGLGNVFLFQGRWQQAEECYREALSRAGTAGPERFRLERAQLYENLGNMVWRQGRLDEAEEHLHRALALLDGLDSPTDEGIALGNLAHLREQQHRPAEALEIYRRALDLPALPPSMRAVIATDLADLCLREGHFGQAEEWGRAAEEYAIASQSPYVIGHMYRGRGNIARELGDVDGFTFYEKALEIAREKGYAALEAETLIDYAILRNHNGGAEEARAYLERARELSLEAGSVHHLRRVEELLAGTSDAAEPAGVGD
jgi:tetratricopeptide (TPR) repeat protein